MKRALAVGAVLLAGGGAALAVGAARWRRDSLALGEALEPGRLSGPPLTAADLQGLPAPVAWYLDASLRVGKPLPRFARLRHEGHFRLGESWKPFTSTEVFALSPAGFLWDAHIRAAPMLSVFVRDSYLDGTGSMHASMAGLRTVVSQRGGAALNAGALQRYLAEACWLPGALLPLNGVAWEPTGESRARATLTDRGTRVSLDFTFNDAKEVTSVFTPARMREVNGRYQPAPWSARLWNYQERGGMRIPLEAEVAWHVDGALQPYWRGLITSAEYPSFSASRV